MYFKFIKSVLLIACLWATSTAFSQNGLFLTGSVEFGGLGRDYHFEQGGTILKRKWIGTKNSDDGMVVISPEINLNYHFVKHFGISLNLKLNDKAAVFHDSRFFDKYNIDGAEFKSNWGKLRADSGNFNPNRNFLGPSVDIQYFFTRDKQEFGLYLSAGFGINCILGKKGHSTLRYFHPSSGDLLELKLDYRKFYSYQYLEFGYSGYLNDIIPASGPKVTTKGVVLGMALRYTFAGNYFRADYQVTNSGVLQYTDKMALGGSYFSVVARAGGSIFGEQIDKRNRRVYQESQEREKLAKKERDERLREMHNRELSVKQELVVYSSNITLSVWDDLKYDQDIITVELNGEAILEDYTLKPSKKTIELKLNHESNQLILHAVSEGKEKPCTVAVLIDDGFTKQQIILNSNMKQSEVLTIKLK